MKKLGIAIFIAAVAVAAVSMLADCSLKVGSAAIDDHMKIDAVYACATGTNDPSYFGLDKKTCMKRSKIKKGDIEGVYVFAHIDPDEKENLLSSLDQAKMTVDDINDYYDDYELNTNNSKLDSYFEKTGYESTENIGTIYPDSDPAKVIMYFSPSSHDLEKGTTAEIEWGDFQASFNIADIDKTCDTPTEIAKIIKKK